MKMLARLSLSIIKDILSFFNHAFCLVAPLKDTLSSNNAVIDTKPIANNKQTVIQASKTVQKPEPNRPASDAQKKIASVVQIQTNVAPAVVSSKVDVVAEPKSKVNVIESVVHVVNAPIVSSKVEVVAGPASIPPPKIISKVEVLSGPHSVQAPQILSSKVEVFEASVATPPAFVVSSVVEVKSEEEPALIGKW